MIKFCKKCGCDTERRPSPPGKPHHVGHCIPCDKAYARKKYLENKEASRQKCKEYYHKNKARSLAVSAAYRANNKERIQDRMRDYYCANKEKKLGDNRVRESACLRARVRWGDQEKIRSIYREAASYRAAGIDVHVDHIVPLKHPLVCGLHNEHNLQILTAHENIAKLNRFDVTLDNVVDVL